MTIENVLMTFALDEHLLPLYAQKIVKWLLYEVVSLCILLNQS